MSTYFSCLLGLQDVMGKLMPFNGELATQLWVKIAIQLYMYIAYYIGMYRISGWIRYPAGYWLSGSYQVSGGYYPVIFFSSNFRFPHYDSQSEYTDLNS